MPSFTKNAFANIISTSTCAVCDKNFQTDSTASCPASQPDYLFLVAAFRSNLAPVTRRGRAGMKLLWREENSKGNVAGEAGAAGQESQRLNCREMGGPI